MAESENAAQPPRAEATDPLVGKVLNGRFKVLERIGAGGMGRVYKALQAPLDRPVALKVLNPNYATDQDPAFAKRFILEASVSSKLTHPNSITIFDYGRSEEGTFFIAMEYLQGRTLHQAIAAEGCLNAPRVVHIARQICRALREAHGLGIVHRDLKPANVMLLHHGDDEDFVKVLDFGLVKFFSEGQNPSPEEGELTQGGIFLGSPTYMAPEQARNQADPRSDIYSLGIVLYHMLSGRPPFSGKAPVDIILKHVNEAPPPFRPELKVPADLEAVVMRSLAKDPAARFQSMDEFLEALKRLGTISPSDILLTDFASQPSRPPPIPTGANSRPASRSGLRPATPQLVNAGSAPRPSLAGPLRPDEEVTNPDRSRVMSGPVLGVAGMIVAALLGTLGVMVFGKKPEPVPAPNPTPVTTPVPTPGPAQHSLHAESTPAGATVSLNGKVLGKTPLDVRVDGDAPPQLQFSLDGYESRSVAAALKGDAFAASAQLLKTPVLAPTPAPNPTPTTTVKSGHGKKKSGSSRESSSTNSAPSGYKDDPYK
ncbi:MAG: serine/threonine protein kinase [Deltaproteobacteria bacterium]|nr:serine/threonine protein kinase [Deltaproteobacteria bacterium]